MDVSKKICSCSSNNQQDSASDISDSAILNLCHQEGFGGSISLEQGVNQENEPELSIQEEDLEAEGVKEEAEAFNDSCTVYSDDAVDDDIEYHFNLNLYENFGNITASSVVAEIETHDNSNNNNSFDDSSDFNESSYDYSNNSTYDGSDFEYYDGLNSCGEEMEDESQEDFKAIRHYFMNNIN